MISTITLAEYGIYSDAKSTAAPYYASYKEEIRQWCYLIGLPIIGLLALFCLLSLGGVFAAIGPWLLLIAVKLCIKHLHMNA